MWTGNFTFPLIVACEKTQVCSVYLFYFFNSTATIISVTIT